MQRIAIAVLAAAAGAAHAGTICRWVDDSGRTQLAETVPPQYAAKAQCTDTQRYELTPAQKAEAEARAARERAARNPRAAAAAASAASAPAAAAPAAEAASAPATLGGERPRLDDRTDCATWRRLYEDSQACFAPFRTVRGAVKAEAYGRCDIVPAPPLRCGPPVR